MTRYEYKVIPAPARGKKVPGIKAPEARFAHALEELMNDMGNHGWDYLRADILPSEERQGLTSSHTVYRSVLVFRRALEEDPVQDGSAHDTVDAEIQAPPPPAMETEVVETGTPPNPREMAETLTRERSGEEPEDSDKARS